MDALQQVLHLLEDLLGGQKLVAGPEEGYVEAARERLEQLLLQAVGFAKLALDAIPLHRPLEVTLADGDHDAHPSHVVGHIDRTDGKGRDRPMAAAEEFLQSLAAAEALRLGKGM